MKHTRPGSVRWWRIASAAMAAALVPALLPPATAQADLPVIPADPLFGITVKSHTWTPQADPLGGTLLDVKVETPAIFQTRDNAKTIPVTVRIHLPRDYQQTAHAPYPVLFLLHGGTDSYDDWWEQGQLSTTLAGTPFDGIVVMPEGGLAGWYTDWYGPTFGGFSPQWETFHIGQLVPWIDAVFNTTGDRSGRTIAGLSMGGFGALGYAARHRDLFSAVGSFSGGTDLTEDGARERVAGSVVGVGAAIGTVGVGDVSYRVFGFADGRMQTVFGPPEPGSSPSDWPDKSPLRMVDRYGDLDKVGIYTGTAEGPEGSEWDLGRWNAEFHDALVAGEVAHRYCYGPGEHSYAYWQNDLVDFLHFVYGTTPTTCTMNNRAGNNEDTSDDWTNGSWPPSA